jgi:peptidoglycan/LPS O-acetylase OafA/YrhL
MKQETVRHNHGAEKIHALTSLRFFAALFVVLFHTTSLFLPWVQGNLLARVLGLGNVSVSFFFLLSGYILGVVYLRRGGPVAAFSFYKARFARVYPLFFLTLVLDTPFLFFDRWSKYGLSGAALKTAATFAANLLMLQAWFLRLRGIDDPNWSLSVETLFYLIFPFVGAVLWKLRGARLWLAATLFYFAGQALVFYAAQHIEGSATSFFPYLHLTTFALGILLARWQSLRKLQDGISQTPSLPVILLVLLLALGAFGVTAYWSPGLNSSNLSDGLLAPLFAVVIWAFSYPD